MLRCPLCLTRIIGADGQAPDALDCMICIGCAGYLQYDGEQVGLIQNPHEVLITDNPELYAELVRARRELIEGWDRADQAPTVFAAVALEVYRIHDKKVH